MTERIEDIFFNNLENLDKAEIRVYDNNWEKIVDFSIRKDNYENTFTTMRCINNNIDTQIKQSPKQLREFVKKMSLELESFGKFEKAIVNGSEIILKI